MYLRVTWQSFLAFPGWIPWWFRCLGTNGSHWFEVQIAAKPVVSPLKVRPVMPERRTLARTCGCCSRACFLWHPIPRAGQHKESAGRDGFWKTRLESERCSRERKGRKLREESTQRGSTRFAIAPNRTRVSEDRPLSLFAGRGSFVDSPCGQAERRRLPHHCFWMQQWLAGMNPYC